MNNRKIFAATIPNGVHLVPLDDIEEETHDIDRSISGSSSCSNNSIATSTTRNNSCTSPSHSRNGGRCQYHHHQNQGNHDSTVICDKPKMQTRVATSVVDDKHIDKKTIMSVKKSVAILADTQQFVNQIGIDWVSKEVVAVKKRYGVFIETSILNSTTSSIQAALDLNHDDADDADESSQRTTKRQKTSSKINDSTVSTTTVSTSLSSLSKLSTLDVCRFEHHNPISTSTCSNNGSVSAKRKLYHQQQQLQLQTHREKERIAIMNQATRMRRISMSFRQLKSTYFDIMNELLSIAPPSGVNEEESCVDIGF